MASSYWLPTVRQSCTAFAAEDQQMRGIEGGTDSTEEGQRHQSIGIYLHVTCAQSESCLFMIALRLPKDTRQKQKLKLAGS